MLGELVPRAGGPPIPLRKPVLLVGRQASCDIAIRFSDVSSRHCELEFRDGYWYVRDLGSRNGTSVNGTACQTQRLLPNDMLTIATHRYAILYTAPPARMVAPGISPRPGSGDIPASREEVAEAEPQQAEQDTPPASAAGSPVLGKLVPCGGGEPIPLHKPTLIVGRHKDSDVVLPLAGVSGRHCQLEWINGCWFVRDLGSRYGTRVDGVPCEAQRLPPGSVLWIANLRYQVVYTPPNPKRAPKLSAFGQGLLEKAGLTGWEPEPPPGRKDKLPDENDPRERYTLDD